MIENLEYCLTQKPSTETVKCQNSSDLNKNPSICFSFKIDDVEMEGIDVTTAVLWIYKKHSFPNSLTQTLYISEVEVDGSNNAYLVKERPLGIHTADVEGELSV